VKNRTAVSKKTPGKSSRKLRRRLVAGLNAALAVLSAEVTLVLLLGVLMGGGAGQSSQQSAMENAGIMDRYDMYITNQVSSALEGILSIQKTYWLSDDDIVAPEPDQSRFGETEDPAEVMAMLDEAAELLEGQDTLFSPDREFFAGSKITYYLDETIMVITWKELNHGAVYTLSEVKIAHPSQFRRFLADGKYGSDKQYLTTEMAASVNAVTASNADFYKHRKMGIIVNNGEVNRVDSRVDTCYIDDKGDLLFTYQGEIKDLETAQKFVEENNVRFSLAFGPVLVDNYEKVVPDYYPLGEIRNIYSRAGLGKLDDLHYLLVAVNEEKGYWRVPNMALFADQMMLFGCEKAYALDGGQTAAIVTNDKLINRPDYGNQRTVSDIIYFATAVPNGG
jgi:hypothetical protein